jgi:PKD repeat protein
MQQKRLVTLCLILVLLLALYRCKKPAPPGQPTACFNYSAATVTVGQPDTFTNCSNDTTFFLWSFGDGNTDRLGISPIHSYSTLGVDTVKLFTWYPGGDTATTSKIVNVVLSDTFYTGNYRGAESCTLAGTDSTGYTVTPNGPSGLLFSNLYNSGKSFTATYSGLNGTIPAQTFSTDSQLLGNFTLSNDTIYLSLIVTAFSFRDNCTGIYVKQ